ncbi:MAG: succinate dehydrogenase / fumarate reductase, iron-sulfur subunit [Clostridia bacterium]|nr:succinate dehydrogenase / fumarate reductase, iron-sulfur subunit [Clostridia bacterium]
MPEKIHLKIKRQDGPDKPGYWEEFVIPYRPRLNVIACLMDIQKNPVNAAGKKTTPVVWECNCLEEVCGACTMVINGKARQACTALIDKLEQPIILEPLSKFPVIRDLMVDRKAMFEHLKRVRAWIDIDGTYNIGPGPRISEKVREWAYELSRCMTCGCCMEACPQVNPRSGFIGPTAIAQVRRFNAHPTGAGEREARLEALMGPGGIAECGNAQNCEKACPKGLPLIKSLAELHQETTLHGVFGWLKR